MISKYILQITFLNEPELILFYTVKWFHLFLSDANNPIHYLSLVCTQFILFKFCNVLLKIQLILVIYLHTINCKKQFYFKQFNLVINKVQWFQVLQCITHNSIKHQLFFINNSI